MMQYTRRMHCRQLLCLITAFFALQWTAFGQTERILIVGDSWAELTWEFGSLDKAMIQAGHSDKIAVGERTALGGTTAEQWKAAAYQQLIASELAAYPTIDVIHLSLGGNDFLGNWNTGMSSSEEQALFQQIAVDLEVLVQFVHGIDPGMQVVLNGYDYVNLEEKRWQDPFTFLLWLLLGTPNPVQLNQAMFQSSAIIFNHLSSNPNVHFVNHAGLMHWAYGYPSHGLAPRTTPLPGNAHNGYRPPLGGDPSLPGPATLMLDGIHYGLEGYDAIGLHCAARFYDAWFDAHP
jgi:lysophospholipase L1-like esterase